MKLRSFDRVLILDPSSKISWKMKELHGLNSLHWKWNPCENLCLPVNHTPECSSFRLQPSLTIQLRQSSPLSIQFHLCTFLVHLRFWSNAVSFLLSRQVHSGCAPKKTLHAGGYSTGMQLGYDFKMSDGGGCFRGHNLTKKASGVDCVQCHAALNFVSNSVSSSLKPRPACLDKVRHYEQMHILFPLGARFCLKLRNGLAILQSGEHENCLRKGVPGKIPFLLCL